jgi:hypothetical protein
VDLASKKPFEANATQLTCHATQTEMTCGVLNLHVLCSQQQGRLQRLTASRLLTALYRTMRHCTLYLVNKNRKLATGSPLLHVLLTSAWLTEEVYSFCRVAVWPPPQSRALKPSPHSHPAKGLPGRITLGF